MKEHNRKFIVPIYTVFKRQKLKIFNNQYIMHWTDIYSRSLAHAVFSGAVFTIAQFQKNPIIFGSC